MLGLTVVEKDEDEDEEGRGRGRGEGKGVEILPVSLGQPYRKVSRIRLLHQATVEAPRNLPRHLPACTTAGGALHFNYGTNLSHMITL